MTGPLAEGPMRPGQWDVTPTPPATREWELAELKYLVGKYPDEARALVEDARAGG